MAKIRVALYCFGEKPHLLDHLAPIGALLGFPLYVESPAIADLARRFYPDVEIILLDDLSTSLEHFANNVDCLIGSTSFAPETRWVLETCYGKRMAFAFTPHGYSDKQFSLAHYPLHDLTFLYGPLHEERLADLQIKPQRSVRLGNLRLSYYLAHPTRWAPLLPRRSRRPVMLYAPTWQDIESGTTLFDRGVELIEQLPEHWDLWIKLHPSLEEHNPASIAAFHPGRATILPPFPPIYPLLAQADVLVGDTSSINYDWLSFQKPLFFLSKPSGPIADAGFTLESGPLFSQIEREINRVPRGAQAALYERVFGATEPLSVIRERLLKALRSLLEGAPSPALRMPNQLQGSVPGAAKGPELFPAPLPQQQS